MAKLAVSIDEQTYDLEVTLAPQCNGGCQVKVDGREASLIIPYAGPPPQDVEWIIIDGRPYELVFDAGLQWIKTYSGLHRVKIQDLEAAVTPPRSSDGRVKAPIPGLITRIHVQEGEQVKAGQPLLVLEAMKMENEIRASLDGRVTALAVAAGQSVAQNDLLVQLTAS